MQLLPHMLRNTTNKDRLQTKPLLSSSTRLPRCRTHFCYLCGKDLTSMGGALYAHFGLRCRAFG